MEIANLLQKNKRFLILLPLLVAATIFTIDVFKTPLYKANVSLLVVQKQGQEIDARTAVKSAEQMADILARIADSESFRATVLASSPNLDLDLPVEPWKKARQWQRIVKTKTITDTGILMVDVYQPDSEQAVKLASAIERVLVGRGYDYLGVNPDSVVIRQLNPPAPTSNYPASPNILLNILIGLFLGLIAAIGLILLFPQVKWAGFLKKPVRSTKSKKHTDEKSVKMKETQDDQTENNDDDGDSNDDDNDGGDGSGMIYPSSWSEEFEKNNPKEETKLATGLFGDNSNLFNQESNQPQSGEAPLNLPVENDDSNQDSFVQRAQANIRR